MDKSGNPALKRSALDRIAALEKSDSATVRGTVTKVVILLALVLVGAFSGWRIAASMTGSGAMILLGSMAGALVFALITIFSPKASPFTAPAYALLEGVLLGAISQVFNSAYNGIALQAILLTLTVFLSTLVLYTSGMVRVTQKMRAIIFIGTTAIALYYLVALVVGLFGGSVPLIYSSGPWGIAFSVVVVFIAAMNLLLDFDFIERTASSKMPKVFEWYGAFGLMVTLIWLYLEILRLLSKIKN